MTNISGLVWAADTNKTVLEANVIGNYSNPLYLTEKNQTTDENGFFNLTTKLMTLMTYRVGFTVKLEG